MRPPTPTPSTFRGRPCKGKGKIDVLKVVRLRARGLSYSWIARYFGVTAPAIIYTLKHFTSVVKDLEDSIVKDLNDKKQDLARPEQKIEKGGQEG